MEAYKELNSIRSNLDDIRSICLKYTTKTIEDLADRASKGGFDVNDLMYHIRQKLGYKPINPNSIKVVNEKGVEEPHTFNLEQIIPPKINDDILISSTFPNLIHCKIIHLSNPDKYVFMEIRTIFKETADFKKWKKRNRENFEEIQKRMKGESNFMTYNSNFWCCTKVV